MSKSARLAKFFIEFMVVKILFADTGALFCFNCRVMFYCIIIYPYSPSDEQLGSFHSFVINNSEMDITHLPRQMCRNSWRAGIPTIYTSWATSRMLPFVLCNVITIWNCSWRKAAGLGSQKYLPCCNPFAEQQLYRRSVFMAQQRVGL